MNNNFTMSDFRYFYEKLDENIYTALAAKLNTADVDADLSNTSTNPLQNKIVKEAIDGKQDSLTTAQLAAVNSGITAERLETIDTDLASMATNCLQRIGTFGASGDFNEQTTIGIYRYNGAPLNHPTSDSGEYGLLMVLAYGSYVSQICHVFKPAVSGIYIRTLVIGSAWSAWNRLTGTAVT